MQNDGDQALVVDDQDATSGRRLGGHRFRSGSRYGLGVSSADWQANGKRYFPCPTSLEAMISPPNEADDPVAIAKPNPVPTPSGLGGEEGGEEPSQHLRRHPGSRVGDPHHHLVPALDVSRDAESRCWRRLPSPMAWAALITRFTKTDPTGIRWPRRLEGREGRSHPGSMADLILGQSQRRFDHPEDAHRPGGLGHSPAKRFSKS